MAQIFFENSEKLHVLFDMIESFRMKKKIKIVAQENN